MKGSSIAITSSITFLFVHYLRFIIRFIRLNYKNGKLLVTTLSIGAFSTIFLGFSLQFMLLHWKYATNVYCFGTILLGLFFILSIKRKYEFNKQIVTLRQGLHLIKNHLVLLFFVVSVYSTYGFLVVEKKAPVFYSNRYPEAVGRLMNVGNMASDTKAKDLKDRYDNFIWNCQGHGLLK